jgi:hypothetical protein
MPYADWAGVTRDLTTALARLDHDDVVIVGEPTGQDRSRLHLGHDGGAPTRYVQAMRIRDVLSAECVGARSLGGTLPMSPSMIAGVRSLGWLTPTESMVEYGNVTPNFGLYVDCTETSGLAALMVASLRVLGAVPASLVLESSVRRSSVSR